jgi:hypothetical protein
MSRVMRARVTPVVIAIVGMMGQRGRPENRAQCVDMDIIAITTMGRGKVKVEREREKEERGARMLTKKYLSRRAGVRRIRDRGTSTRGRQWCLI